MKITVRLIVFIVLTICFSCEEQGLIVYCADCTSEEPVTTNLEIKLGLNHYLVDLIQIYEGNLEDGILMGSFVPSSKTFTKNVSINKKYTITATYNISNKKYIAVDSATPRVRYDKTQCDNPCYFVYDRVVDLRLKNIH